MRRDVAVAVVVGGALLGLAVGSALAATEDEPRFEVYTPDPRLEPGEVQAVTVELVNDAADPEDRVPDATAVRIEPRAGRTPFELRTETVALGRMVDGEIREVDLRLAVPTDVPGGTYRVPLRIEHEYDGDERDRDTVRARVTVPHRPIFRVAGTASGLRSNESGTATVTVENDGSRPAGETVLEIASPDPGLALDAGGPVNAYVGTLAAGETRTVTVEAAAAGDGSARAYPLSVRPTYVDRDNVSQAGPTLTTNVSVGPPQAVAVRAVSLDPYGTTGILTTTVENAGPAPIRSAVATLSSSTGAVRPVDETATVGQLAPRNSTNVSFRVDVDRSATPGPHLLELRLRYDRGGADRYLSDPATVAVRLPDDRSRLSVEPAAGSLEAGASNALAVRLTNGGDTRLADVEARLGVAAPYTSAKPSAFVGALPPGESTLLTFEVTVPEHGVPGADSLPLNLSADLPDGRTVVDRTHTVGVSYQERTPFAVETENGTLEPDASNAVDVRLTHTGDTRLTDLRAHLDVASPYESAKPSAYVGALEPGESTLLTFEITAPDDAVPGSDSLPLRITAELPDGRPVVDNDRRVTLTYPTDAGAGGDVLVLVVGAVVVALVLGAGIWWLRH
jgi:hypothetical protein